MIESCAVKKRMHTKKNSLAQGIIVGETLIEFPLFILEFLWRNYHCYPFHRCLLLQKYLYIEIILSMFCIGSHKQNEPKYRILSDQYFIIVAEKICYPRQCVRKFSTTSAHQAINYGHVIEVMKNIFN